MVRLWHLRYRKEQLAKLNKKDILQLFLKGGQKRIT